LRGSRPARESTRTTLHDPPGHSISLIAAMIARFAILFVVALDVLSFRAKRGICFEKGMEILRLHFGEQVTTHLCRHDELSL
jgi:hypothetical protein